MPIFPFSPLEQRIWNHYKHCGVHSPRDITLYLWDQLARFNVVRCFGQTHAIPTRSNYTIFLNSVKSLPERRIEMAHEIGHAILHIGFQSQLTEF